MCLGLNLLLQKVHNILMHSFRKPETCFSGLHIRERVKDVHVDISFILVRILNITF